MRTRTRVHARALHTQVALHCDSLQHAFTFGRAEGPGKLQGPMGLAIHKPTPEATAPDGVRPKPLLFVADREHHSVFVYDLAGDYVRCIGRKGTAPAEFLEPLGVAADAERVFVCEGLGARLQVRKRGHGPWAWAWGVCRGPCAMCEGPRRSMPDLAGGGARVHAPPLTRSMRPRARARACLHVQVLSPEGVSLFVLPSPGNSRLCGVARDADRLFLTEFEANRLHEFRLLDRRRPAHTATPATDGDASAADASPSAGAAPAAGAAPTPVAPPSAPADGQAGPVVV